MLIMGKIFQKPIEGGPRLLILRFIYILVFSIILEVVEVLKVNETSKINSILNLKKNL
jgi:hypothetical protein